MLSRVRTIFLLVAMLWQSMCVFGPLSAAERTEDLGHLTLHAQSADHHHHDDGSVHEEDSGGGFQQHQHADGGPSQAGLLTTGWPHTVTSKPLSPAELVKAGAPAPDVDGLLRPPPGETPERPPGVHAGHRL